MNTLPSPLIDVLSDESFASEHLPGAKNLCVYETAFLDKAAEAFPDKGAALTVYGLSDRTREAETAAERLRTAGYTNVSVLPGGLEGWKQSGGEIERGAGHSSVSGTAAIDPEASSIRWTGRNLFNFHTGLLSLKEGSVAIKDGRVTGGEFVVDMNSLSCSDLTDSTYNQMLIAHLRSDDFFAVEENPTAKFVLTDIEYLDRATAGAPNYRLWGHLTVREKTHSLELSAVIAGKPDGTFTGQAYVEFDRTLFSSLYGSGKFFARLGQHVVNDLVHLQLKLVTQAVA